MRGDLGSFARGLAGSVRLLSNTAALSEYLPKVLAGFLTANPTISLDLEERESADIAAALGAGAADVGIASVAALPDTIQSSQACPGCFEHQMSRALVRESGARMG